MQRIRGSTRMRYINLLLLTYLLLYRMTLGIFNPALVNRNNFAGTATLAAEVCALLSVVQV